MKSSSWRRNGIDGGILPTIFSRNGAPTMESVGKELLKNTFPNSRGWSDLDLVDDSVDFHIPIRYVNSHTYGNCSN